MTQYIRYPTSGGGGSGTVNAIGPIDSQPKSANGGVIDGSDLIFQTADATYPGLVSIGTQTFAGNKTFTGTIAASNLSGTNTGDVTLTAVGAIPNANGASLSGQVLTLQPADATFPGVLLAADWVRFDNAATLVTTGSPNTFAGFSNTGVLETIPGWSFDNVNNGVAVNLTQDPDYVSSTLNSFYNSFNPTATNSNNSIAFSIYTDYDVPNAGFDSGNIDILDLTFSHRGDGVIPQARMISTNQSAGNGGNTGSVNQLDNIVASSSIGSGFTVQNGRGISFQLSNSGSITNDYSGLDINLGGNNIGNQLVGISLNQSADTTGNQTGINFNIQGDSGSDLNILNGGNSGAITNNFSVLNTNNTGAIGNGYNGINLNNSNTASVVSNFNGLNVNNQATVGQFFNGNIVVNSGVITKGLNGFSVSNSANVGDGTGTSLIGFNSNFQTGTVDGNIFGLNIFNDMAVIGNNAISAVSMFNNGNGYSFKGISISNNSNQSEDARAFQYASSGNSRTTTGIDLQMSGTITDDAYGSIISMNGIAAGTQATGLSVRMGTATDGNPQGVVGIESDGRIQVNATTQLVAGQGFQIGNRIESLFSVPIGSPVTGTDSIGDNFAGDFLVQDDVAVGGFGIGWNSVGFIASVAVAATKTVDKATVFLPAISLPDPGFTTGGTISELNIIAAYAPVPSGGSIVIGDAYVFKLDPLFGNYGTYATNAWGVWIGDTTVDNWFAKDVVIAGSTGKPVGSEVLTVNGDELVDGTITMIGSTSGNFTQAAADTTTSYSVKWPAAQGAASDVLTNDGSGNLSWSPAASSAPADSTIWLDTNNGFGSTNTTALRFQNNPTSTGTDITYTDDASLGAYLTINTSGRYSITISLAVSSVTTTASGVAIALGSVTGGTASLAVAAANTLNREYFGVVANSSGVIGPTWTGYLNSSDVISFICDVSPVESVATTLVRISRIS